MATTDPIGARGRADSPTFPLFSAPVRLTLEAEISLDADTGVPELLISHGSRLYEVGSADDLRAAIVAEQARLDQLSAMADAFEAMTSRPSSSA